MPGLLARFLDRTLDKGILATPSSSVFANGKPLVLFPCKVLPHPPFKGPHKFGVTRTFSTTVFAEGRPVQVTMNSTTCKSIIFSGSTDIIVG